MTELAADRLLETRRFRLGCANGPMTLPQGAAAAPAPGGGYDGPDADKLEVWWSATQPLETLDANAYAMQTVFAGDPRFVELDGRQAYAKAVGRPGYEDAASGSYSISPSAGDTWTIYAMVHAPSTGTASHAPVSLTDTSGAAEIMRITLDPSFANAFSRFGGVNLSDQEPYAKDVAVVLHSETIFNPSAGYSVEAGTDDTQSGTPATTASGSPTTALDSLRIAFT